MMNWLQALAQHNIKGSAHVLVTVTSVEGSAPRPVGTKMVVAALDCHDTIGGGNLEYQAIATAREMLQNAQVAGQATRSTVLSPSIHQTTISLGQDLNQCCGGRVGLMFELFAAKLPHIALFGAGHVGQALMTVLAALPYRVSWYDSRLEFVTQAKLLLERLDAAAVQVAHYSNPHSVVEQCEQNTCFIIMTHSHEIDIELCEAVLSRDGHSLNDHSLNDHSPNHHSRGSAISHEWCGLIASASKAASFKSRLSRKGFTETELSRLIAPIGLPEIAGKEPMAVAVSIAAQLLALRKLVSTAD